MQGLFYKFYVRENQRIRDRLVWEWLLEQASKLGLRGGSAVRTMAGFGRHQHLHEAFSFESEAPAVQLEFLVTAEESQKLLGLLGQEKLQLFYTRMPAQFGFSNAQAAESIESIESVEPMSSVSNL